MFRRDQKPKATTPNQKQQENVFFQPKLNFGKSGDKYEVEADKMADKVVNKPVVESNKIQKNEEEVQQKPLASQVTPVIQKMESGDEENVQQKSQEEENPVQKMEEDSVQSMDEDTVQEKEDEEVQSKSEKVNIGNGKKPLEPRLRKGNGGQVMEKGIRSEMESGFGADFSKVKIHNDSEASNMSASIGAQAFTHGNDIYFNKGKYNPSSKEGKHLLAHELTHTIQQKGMVQKKVQRTIVDPNDTIFENARERRYHTRVFRVYMRVLRSINPNVNNATVAQRSQAENIMVSILSSRRWYRRGPVRQLQNNGGFQSANRSNTTGMFVRKNINTTRTIAINNMGLPQQVTMQADDVWRQINLDPNNQLNNMNGTVTAFISSDLGQPDILEVRYFRRNGTPSPIQRVLSDTSRNPNPFTVNQSAPIVIPLQNMGSPIIMYRARPILPNVSPSQSRYNLTITVNGTATVQNIRINSGIDGISKDPTNNNNPLNKNYQIR